MSSTGTFITNGFGIGKTFSWNTTNNAFVGTYAIKVIGLGECRVVEKTFNLVVKDHCESAVITIDDTKIISSALGFTITQSIWQDITTVTYTEAANI